MRIHGGEQGKATRKGYLWRMIQVCEHIWGYLEEKRAGLRGAKNAKALRWQPAWHIEGKRCGELSEVERARRWDQRAICGSRL